MNQEIGREITMQHIAARPEELHTVGNSQTARKPLIPLDTRITCHHQTETAARGQEADCVEQWLQALQPIIHCRKEPNRFGGTDSPLFSPLETASWPIVLW